MTSQGYRHRCAASQPQGRRCWFLGYSAGYRCEEKISEGASNPGDRGATKVSLGRLPATVEGKGSSGRSRTVEAIVGAVVGAMVWWGHLSIGPYFLVSFEASQTRPKSRCLGACENSLDWAALVLVGSLLLVRMIILSHVIHLSYLIKSLV